MPVLLRRSLHPKTWRNLSDITSQCLMVPTAGNLCLLECRAKPTGQSCFGFTSDSIAIYFRRKHQGTWVYGALRLKALHTQPQSRMLNTRHWYDPPPILQGSPPLCAECANQEKARGPWTAQPLDGFPFDAAPHLWPRRRPQGGRLALDDVLDAVEVASRSMMSSMRSWSGFGSTSVPLFAGTLTRLPTSIGAMSHTKTCRRGPRRSRCARPRPAHTHCILPRGPLRCWP